MRYKKCMKLVGAINSWWSFVENGSARSNLMNQDPSPTLDTYLNELLQEEQCFQFWAVLEKQKAPFNVASVAKGKQRLRDTSKIQCYLCMECEHAANQCKTECCNYCKGAGHLVSECQQPPYNQSNRAYHVTTSDSSVPTAKWIFCLWLIGLYACAVISFNTQTCSANDPSGFLCYGSFW